MGVENPKQNIGWLWGNLSKKSNSH